MILGAAPSYQLHVAEIQIPLLLLLLHHELAEPMVQHRGATNLEIGFREDWTEGQELVHLMDSVAVDAEITLAVPLRCLHHKL